MLAEEDRVLINVLKVLKKEYGAKRILNEFMWSVAFCKTEFTAARSVTSTIWKNDNWRIASLWSRNHW